MGSAHSERGEGFIGHAKGWLESCGHALWAEQIHICIFGNSGSILFRIQY